MRTKTKLFAFIILVVALIGCGSGGGGDNNPPPVTAQVWTWISGSKYTNQAGVYGSKGIPAPSNFPGARSGAVSWIDSQGKLWLFGGGTHFITLTFSSNDLWKYDPTTHMWTWVSGGDPENQAGIYGTKGIPNPANVPGARSGAVSWFGANGDLWLFGGRHMVSPVAGGLLNDLWKYNLTTLEWTWVSGSDALDQAGIYGTKGVPDPSSIPGARSGAVSWTDPQGNLWLFGGWGSDSTGNGGDLNDLWKFDPITLEWTWVSGSDAADQAGIYGTKGVPDPSNIPGARPGGLYPGPIPRATSGYSGGSIGVIN